MFDILTDACSITSPFANCTDSITLNTGMPAPQNDVHEQPCQLHRRYLHVTSSPEGLWAGRVRPEKFPLYFFAFRIIQTMFLIIFCPIIRGISKLIAPAHLRICGLGEYGADSVIMA